MTLMNQWWVLYECTLTFSQLDHSARITPFVQFQSRYSDHLQLIIDSSSSISFLPYHILEEGNSILIICFCIGDCCIRELIDYFFPRICNRPLRPFSINTTVPVIQSSLRMGIFNLALSVYLGKLVSQFFAMSTVTWWDRVGGFCNLPSHLIMQIIGHLSSQMSHHITQHRLYYLIDSLSLILLFIPFSS